MFSLLDDSCKRFNLDLCIKTIHLDFEDRMHVTVTHLFQDVVTFYVSLYDIYTINTIKQ